jgi:hypothetical protein
VRTAPAAADVPHATTLAQLRSGQSARLAIADARDRIREQNAVAGRHVVVLDDDPTGSQAVHDVPVLTGWDDADLIWAFAHPARCSSSSPTLGASVPPPRRNFYTTSRSGFTESPIGSVPTWRC